MNSAVGTQYNKETPVTGPWLTGSYGANRPGNPYDTYGNLNSFTNPGPANTFVILDEDPYSINDADFAVNCTLPDALIDNPASFHDRGAGFSFADGHAEIKHWADPRTYAIETLRGHPFPGVQTNNPDIEWLRLRTSAYGNGQPMPLSVPPSP
jgi:prepilin-type processing-associated H-X9-DG protein